MADYLGPARCPLCAGQARASLMKTGRMCLVCNGCKFQAFARGDDSDELLRRFLQGHHDPAPPAAAPAPAPVPAPAVQAPAPAPAEPRPFTFGFFR